MRSTLSAVAALVVLSSTCLARVAATSAAYEIRIVPESGIGLSLTGGTTTSTSIRFVVQARATTAVNETNYGINRWSNGSITGPIGSTVVRATSNDANSFGRFRSIFAGQPQNFARFQAAGGTGGTTPTGVDTNGVNGTLAGNTITGIDAYRGLTWPGIGGTDANGDPISNMNPWSGFTGSIGGPVTNGTPSQWQNLYAFTMIGTADAPVRKVTIRIGGELNIASSIAPVAGVWTFSQLPVATSVSTLAGAAFTFFGPYLPIPSPAAMPAAMLAGLVLTRRRR